MLIILAGMFTPALAGNDFIEVNDVNDFPDADVVISRVRANVPDPVVGGEEVSHNRWPDAAGIVYNGQSINCTGVLIAPDVALTAGHCYGGITHIALDTHNYFNEIGELIPVSRSIKYGDVYNGIDITLLLLSEEAETPPRIIANDCVKDEDFKDGAEVAIVGFGATKSSGNGWTSLLHEGFTNIQDHDCSEDYIDGIYTGCNPSERPGGELGAGGNGVDSCYGDSGGPLYLTTDRGDFLVGITSRAYSGVPQGSPCYYGGIYGRPDAIIDWIEENANITLERPQCNEAPNVHAEDIVTTRGSKGTTLVLVDDPDGLPGEHTYSIVQPPEHGTATIHESGLVIYEPEKGFTGVDSLTVGVTDGGNPDYAASGPITTELDVTIDVEEGGLCACASTSPRTGWFLLPGVMLFARRRQR